MNFKELQERISAFQYNDIVMVGLGNPIRRDDSAGLKLLKEIEQRRIVQGAHFIFAKTTPENHLAAIIRHKPKLVVFLDTVRRNEKPGNIGEISQNVVANRGFSTHSYSIKLIEEYLHHEGVEQFLYIGIEPENMEMGTALSPVVQKGINAFFQ